MIELRNYHTINNKKRIAVIGLHTTYTTYYSTNYDINDNDIRIMYYARLQRWTRNDKKDCAKIATTEMQNPNGVTTGEDISKRSAVISELCSPSHDQNSEVG